MSKDVEVIILGAGPAGIFSALSLVEKGFSVLILEKGSPLEERSCPRKDGFCANCSCCGVLNGWGGAGAFSDGKLTFSPEFGGNLKQFILEENKLRDLFKQVDNIFLEHGAPAEIFGAEETVVRDLRRRASAVNLEFMPAPIRHLGTENCYRVLQEISNTLQKKCTIRFRSPVQQILVEDDTVKGVLLESGETLLAPYIICAPGRQGTPWFFQESKRLGLTIQNNPVDIGVRVEIPAWVMEDITSKVHESKFHYYAPFFDDKVRTFCMNPNGQVVLENSEGVITVNGHSYRDKLRHSENTNFALLVSKNFTEPFKEPIRYGRYIASLANMLGGGVLVQRLGDLLAGQRTTVERLAKGIVKPTLQEATPGDLSLVLPYRYLRSILEMLEALERLAPGIYSRSTLLYGVEVKFYSHRLELNTFLETEIKNLFAVGDGAGITRGLVQASASGLLAAEEILRRLQAEG